MTISQKIKIAQAVTKLLKWNYDLPIGKLESLIKLNPYFLGKFTYLVPQVIHLNNPTHVQLKSLKEKLQAEIDFKSVSKRMFLHVYPDQNKFINDVLTQDLKNLFDYRKPSKIVIEFSSPNIAKPFHFGSLRSTIIGNFIANITKYFGDEVVKMNYLGDWGPQFGWMKIGLEEGNYDAAKILENPLMSIQEAYANAVKKYDDNSEIAERARNIFSEVDLAGDDNITVKEWHTFKVRAIKDLSRVYNRLGVTFDEYAWESDYSAKRIQPLINKMKENGILRTEYDGSLVVMLFGEVIPFTKYDGTSLYLSRDVAAALDRYRQHKFDHMYYVVDSAQKGHFAALECILKTMDSECADKIRHIPCGRVNGPNPQRGENVWLDNILNVLQDKTSQLNLKSINTNASISAATVDILSLSALIVNDLRQMKVKHYDFSWDVILRTDGFSGFMFQYTHCKLVSLEKNCEVMLPSKCEPYAFVENEALVLINHIGRFRDVLSDSYSRSEACFLTTYLFELCSHIDRALQKLKIKDDDSCIASQRLLLFVKARSILNLGMKILGLTPLDKI